MPSTRCRYEILAVTLNPNILSGTGQCVHTASSLKTCQASSAELGWGGGSKC